MYFEIITIIFLIFITWRIYEIERKLDKDTY